MPRADWIGLEKKQWPHYSQKSNLHVVVHVWQFDIGRNNLFTFSYWEENLSMSIARLHILCISICDYVATNIQVFQILCHASN